MNLDVSKAIFYKYQLILMKTSQKSNNFKCSKVNQTIIKNKFSNLKIYIK
jgi:hypothetical protein